MQTIFSLALGYILGSFSSASLVGKQYNVDLSREGTGNLGATNTAHVLGKGAGLRVLVMDMAKSILSYKLARYLFPQLIAAGMLASLGAIVGHCFPVFHLTQGGKGLAAFAGLVLVYDVGIFLLILLSGSAVMMLLDTGVAATVLGTVLFPVLVYCKCGCPDEVLAALGVSVLILFTHRENIRLALEGRDELRPREFFWGNKN